MVASVAGGERREFEAVDVDEAAIGDAELGQHRQAQEAELHERRLDRDPEGPTGLDQRVELGGDLAGETIRHEPADRQPHLGEHLTVEHHDLPAADLPQAVDRGGHLGRAGRAAVSDRHAVVGVVGDGGCDGAALDAEAMIAELAADNLIAALGVGLELHPEKTRMIEFGRFAEDNRKRRGEGKPETFDFLGFTHICGKTWKGGWFTVKRRTVKKRLRDKLQEIRQELRKRWHERDADTGSWLRSVVQGYFNYHAVPGNFADRKSVV